MLSAILSNLNYLSVLAAAIASRVANPYTSAPRPRVALLAATPPLPSSWPLPRAPMGGPTAELRSPGLVRVGERDKV